MLTYVSVVIFYEPGFTALLVFSCVAHCGAFVIHEQKSTARFVVDLNGL